MHILVLRVLVMMERSAITQSFVINVMRLASLGTAGPAWDRSGCPMLTYGRGMGGVASEVRAARWRCPEFGVALEREGRWR